MEISPEERKTISEEDRARIDRKAQTTDNRTGSSQQTSTGLAPNIEAFLCYLGAWVTGIIFLIVEQKNASVRFHAAQSILVFGPLLVAGSIFEWIPVSGWALSLSVSIIALVLWIVLMVKAYRNEAFEIPIISNLARQLTGGSNIPYSQSNEIQVANTGNPPKLHEPFKYVPGSRMGRLVGSSLAIAWSSAMLVFMNYYHQYIAIYHGQTSNGVTTWIRDPILNQDIHQWLPILNVALFASIVGNIITIIWDRYLLREPIKIFIDVLNLYAIVSLAIIFPFDFSAFPELCQWM